MVTPQDAKIEKRVESEDIKELAELREVSELLVSIRRCGFGHSKNLYEDLETASRLILDAKRHNERIRKLSSKLWKDLASFRGGATDKYLTGEERQILATTQGMSVHLSNLATNIEYIAHVLKTGGRGEEFGVAWYKINDCYNQVWRLISTVEGLFKLEQQLETAMKRAWK